METIEILSATAVNSLPNVSLFAGNDSLRPYLQYIKFEWSKPAYFNDDIDKRFTFYKDIQLNCIVTDGCILSYFNFLDFILVDIKEELALMYPNGFYIHADYFKPLTDKKIYSLEFKADCIKVYSIKNQYPVVIPIEQTVNGSFPNWKQVIPGNSMELDTIGFNAEYLSKIGKVFSKLPIKFEFTGSFNPARFKVLFNNHVINGLICPQRIDNF